MIIRPTVPTPGVDHIPTKAEFYKLYQPYALGNTIRQYWWAEWKKLFEAGQEPKDVAGWAVRVTIPDNPFMKYELSREECVLYCKELEYLHGLRTDQIQVSELAPDHKLTLQGHVMRGTAYLNGEAVEDFFDDPRKNRMRDSMKRFKPYSGLHYHSLLKSKMDAPSWTMINELWDRYPDSIIEYAIYSIPVGWMGINTIIWEVRDY